MKGWSEGIRVVATMTEKAKKILYAIPEEYLSNHPKEVVGKTKYWIEIGDPIISAAFDVATGRRMVELFEKDLALKFLGGDGALREIKRSANSGFLSKKDADKLAKNLRSVIKILKNDGFNDTLEIYSILHKLRNIQIFLDKQHYASFLGWLRI